MKINLQRIPRIIYNDDTCSLRYVPPPHTARQISIPVDYLKGAQVDVLCWLMAEEVAYAYHSKIIENLYDLLGNPRAYAKGTQGDYNPAKRDPMWSLRQRGVDYLPILIRNAQKNEIAFYASFRMNDTHFKTDPQGSLCPEFWKEHQQYRLWEVTDGKSYYNAASDYSFAEVRRRKTDTVREVAEEYNVDGIELDLCRNPYFFQPSEAWTKRSVLTDFVAEIREGLDRITATAGRVGARRKRPIGRIVRIPIDEERLTAAGIDAERWIDKKLMDILVMSHLTNNYNQPLGPWLQRCRRKGILFYPSVERTPALYDKNFYEVLANPVAPAHNYVYRPTPETDAALQRGMAANYLAQGADGIYMFNYPCTLFQDPRVAFNGPAFKTLTSVLAEMGSLKTLWNRNKTYTYFPDLPIWVEANRPPQYHQTIRFKIFGNDLASAAATLCFRQIAERNPHAEGQFRQNPIVSPGFLKYYVNGEEIPAPSIKRRKQSQGTIPSGFKLKTHEQIEITLPGSKLKNGENTLAFAMDHFPRARDPYVYIYDLEVALVFDNP
ncbi:MAG: hypothetical protein HY360_04305 [Verrucomicrobia bacterium]|nr:hypothetical protein [Verrucomicrobiota bacterium]